MKRYLIYECKKRITRKEVAEAAGVSETTVSVVINSRQDIVIAQETRGRVRKGSSFVGIPS